MRERYEYHLLQYDRGQEEYKGRSLVSNDTIRHPFHQFLRLHMEIALCRIHDELKSIFNGI
jgi:hypothetical protein